MILLLVVIYITFISLGIPDSLFGTTWPLVHLDFNVPENFGSLFSIIAAAATGGTSLFAGRLLRKFGTGRVTAVSVFMTAVGLLGIGLSSNIFVMAVFIVISSLGAGAIDTSLNNFVSLRYKSRHMNWLHCFWGVGVTASPLIMSFFLKSSDWQGGYRFISYIQFALALIVFMSLFLWKKYDKPIAGIDNNKPIAGIDNKPIAAGASDKSVADINNNKPIADIDIDNKKEKVSYKQLLKSKGLVFAVCSVGFYCAMEFLLGTWGASYLVNARSFTPDTASLLISLYYGGIMTGRLLAGFVSGKLGDTKLIRGGIVIAAIGAVVLCFQAAPCAFIGLIIIGLGFGPIFPSSVHAVPTRFKREYSADIIGLQMMGAYVIGYLSQLAFGFTATATTFLITPFVLIAFLFLLSVFSEITIKKTSIA